MTSIAQQTRYIIEILNEFDVKQNVPFNTNEKSLIINSTIKIPKNSTLLIKDSKIFIYSNDKILYYIPCGILKHWRTEND